MRFEVKAPDGRTVVLEGDSRPTDADLDEIFASIPQKQQSPVVNDDIKQKAFEINKQIGVVNDDGTTKGSWVNSDWIRKPVAAMQGVLNANPKIPFTDVEIPANPVGFMARGLNATFGNGEWELPESLKSFTPETKTEKAIQGAADVATSVYGGLALGNGLGASGALGKGVSVPSKLARGFVSSENPARVARQIAQGEAINDYFDIQNPVARLAVGLSAANPASTLKTLNKGIELAGKGIGNTLGLSTGMGGKSVAQLYDAGKRGSKEALRHMRGKGDTDEIVEAAQTGLKNMKKARSSAYAQTKEAIKQNGQKLSTNPIREVYDDVKSQYVDRGWKASSKEVDKVLTEANKVIKDFEQNPQVHDAIGFDTLKQRISQIKTEAGSAAETAKRKLVGGLREKITEVAPEYSNMMKDYAKASKAVDAMEEAFSLTKGSDTIFNKLKSALRDNVQTNFGRRAELAQQLEEAGAKGLKDMVAGQAARSVMPRGLAQSGIALIGGKMGNPAVALMSPRLVGEGVYKAGQLAGLSQKALSSVGAKQALDRAIAEGFNKGTISLPALSAILDGLDRKGE